MEQPAKNLREKKLHRDGVLFVGGGRWDDIRWERKKIKNQFFFWIRTLHAYQLPKEKKRAGTLLVRTEGVHVLDIGTLE
jgi:hypothetical protein